MMELNRLEEHVLLATIRLHPNGYGVAIRNVIETHAHRRYSFGAIYAALDKLQSKGFVTSKEGEPEKKRGGRRKLYFTITAEGRIALDRALNALVELGRGAGSEEALGWVG